MIIENLLHARYRNGAGRALRAVASVALAAASLVAPAAAYGAVAEVEKKPEQNITFSIPTSLRCAVRADGTVIAPSGWSMSNSGSGKVEITGVSVSNAIGKLKLSGKSGTIGYAVGNGNGSYSVSYDAAGGCKFSSTSNRPLGIEFGKSLSWNWNIGKLNASDHRAALDAAASGRARLCDMSFSYAPVGNSLSSEGTTGSMSGTVNSQSSSVMPVGGTATANVSNAPSNASLSYQWYTVDSNGSYSAIANANGKTLKVLAAYRGKDIVCRVSDSSGHYSGYVETTRKPVRNLAPKVGISGSAVYGGKLTATASGLPSGATYTYKYKWQRLSDSSWTDIANATAAEYTLGGEDVGKQVRVIVSTASNIYTVDDVTAVSATVAKAKASIGVSISGTKNNSSRLTASVSGLPAAGTNTVSYRWQRSSDGKANWVDSTAGDAKSNSIQIQPNDVSWHYRCIVSASNPYYDIAPATSAAYGPIAKSTVSAARATISGNAVYGGTIKANVTNVPSVGTNSISYRWQYSDDGKAWNDTSLAGGKTSSLVLSAVSCVGTQYRCVISVDNSYYIVPGCSTGGIKVGKASAQAVAKASGEAVAGKKLTVAVSGLPTVGGTNKVYYQWQFSNDGKTWGGSTLDGATTSTLHLYDSDNVAHSMIGFSYRCIVSVSGNSAYDIKSATSNVIGPVVKGTAAAPSVSVGGTKKIESTLKATVTGLPKYGNSNVSYQWQTSADGSTWADSTQSDAKSVSFKPAYSLVGKYARCAVSVSNDQYNVATGYSAAYGKLGKASKTISAAITSPNKRNGDTLTCGISGLASNGSNTLAYKWEYAADSAFTKDLQVFDDPGNTHITAWGTNRYYRCTVTASNPYYEYNTAVSPVYGPLAKGVASAPTVTVSGSNAWGSTLKATVTGLPKYGNNKVSYQWEARDDSSTSWGNSGYATATTDHITVDAQDAVSKARHYRCKVTIDNDQYIVPVAYSADHGKTVKASATPKVTISGGKSYGSSLTANVSGQPSGTTSTTYQWQRASSASGSYANIPGATGKTYKTSTADANKYVRVLVNTANTYYTVSQGVSAGYGAILAPKSFAIYSDGDKSLKFYRRSSVPKLASTFNGQIVTELYENIESTSYSNVPWSSHAAQIEEIDIVDGGIKPTSISGWFNGATALAKMNNISKLDVSATKDMSYAFSGCEQLTKIDLSSWNTASCTNMSYMFSSCKQLMQVNVSSFRTSSVTDYSDMFYQCSNITDLDISNFDTRNAKSISLMMADTLHMQRFKIGANFKIVNTNFVGTPLSINIPGADSRWHSSTGGIYTSATIPSLKADTYYALANRTCVQQAYAVYSIDDNSLSFYKRSEVPDIGHIFNGKTATRVYPNIEAYDDTTLFHASPWSLWVAFLRTAKVVDSGIQPRSTAWWFYLCTAMTTCDLSKLDTSKCVNMCWMFRSCSSLTTLDVSKLDTHLVTDLSSMFRDSPELGELDVRNWNVSKATNMGNMFNSCRRLTDLTGAENWNTSSNEHFDYMFANCVKLTLNASRWDTSAAKGATKHTGFNSMAPGVRAPQWHGLIGLNATSVENDSNPDMPSDDIAVDSNDIQDDKSACDRNGNSDTIADGAIHDDVDNSDNVDSVDSDNVDNVDSDIENQQSSDDMTSQESLPEQLE